MTYILGWKNDDNVFLAADSATTALGTTPTTNITHSSFGEQHTINERGVVEETMLKLCCVSNKAIVAMAGDISLAVETVRVFETALKTCANIKEAFEKAICSCGPYSKDTDVGLIMGCMDKGKTRLYSYNSKRANKVFEHDTFTQLGSIKGVYPTLTEKIVKCFIERKLPGKCMQIAVTAILQSYGILDILMNMGVGGVFFGLSINSSGIHWQPDTSYVLYSPDFSDQDSITVIARDGILAVRSSVIDFNKLFANNVNSPLCRPEDLNAMKPKLTEFFYTGRSDFYVWLSKKDRLITVVNANGRCFGQYMKICANGHGYISLACTDKLKKVLEAPNRDFGKGLPYRFNWLSCNS